MTTTIQINERGTLTIPKILRKRLGFEGGGLVLVEESGDGLVIRPAVTFPYEIYSNERIAEFDKEDEELNRHLKKKEQR